MIVVDASAFLELLLHSDRAETVAERLLVEPNAVHAPHLVDLEIAQTIRRFLIHGRIDIRLATDAIEDISTYPIQRHAHFSLLPRMWELRANISAYDAIYVALAEMLGAQLLTCDRRLAKAGGDLIDIDVI